MANYYVSAAGNDSNAGTSTGSPWLTITHVNAKIVDATIQPGDTVFLRGGDTFSGNLLVTIGITVDSYGTGTATINPGTSYGVRVQDCSSVVLQNFTVAGPGVTVTGTYPNATATTTSAGDGIDLRNTTLSTYMAGIRLRNLTVTGCYNGIEASNLSGGGNSITQSYDDLQITNCTVSGCGEVGIALWGDTNYSSMSTVCNRNCLIQDCLTYNIYGITATPVGSGFGVLMLNSLNGIVNRCCAHDIAIACNNTAGNGPTGIITLFSNGQRTRNCESYNVYAPSNVDGTGFDFDTENTDCILEYCYAHDCSGSGMFFYGNGTNTGLVVRYCLIVNCGITNQNASIVTTFGDVGVPLMYNNTFYQNVASGNMFNFGSGIQFFNNIVVAGGGATFGQFSGTCSFKGNTYQTVSGASFSIDIAGTTYTSLSDMQTAGFEKQGGSPVGASGDPHFTTAGFHGAIMPAAALTSLVAYDLNTSSAAQGAGVSQSILGVPVVTTDWHGNSANAGVDSGMVRFGSTFTAGGISTGPSRRKFGF